MSNVTNIDEDREWQTTCKVMKERGALLRQSGQWADCTLLVGAESRPFQAHKLILSMASPFFESLLIGGDEENKVMNIPDADPEAFDKVLNYIYTEDININSFMQARDIYCCADKFMLHQLAHVCITYMSCNVTIENVCESYELGLLFNENSLIDESVEIIKFNTKSVISTKGFEQVHLDTASKIFSIEGLQIDNELDLFHAAERYVRAQRTGVKRRRLGDAKMNERNDENENIVLANNNDGQKTPGSPHSTSSQSESKVTIGNSARTLLQHIRFLSLTAAQFAQVARSELLAEHESFALLVNILYPATELPLPSGFCTSRESRYLRPPPPPQKLVSSLTIRFSVPSPGLQKHSVTSPPHSLLGQRCRLHILPRFESSTSGYMNTTYLGIFLRWEIAPESKWACVASLEIRLLSSKPDRHLVKTLRDIRFDSANCDIGYTRFVSVSELAQYKYVEYLQDGGAVTFEVRIDAQPCDETPSHSK